jgi:hypothetical protein
MRGLLEQLQCRSAPILRLPSLFNCWREPKSLNYGCRVLLVVQWTDQVGLNFLSSVGRRHALQDRVVALFSWGGL